MPVQPVPFIAKTNKNVDQIELAGNTVDIIDGFIDEAGFINRRPGMPVFSTISGAGKLDGLYFWDEKSVTIAVSAGIVYSISSLGVATTVGSGLQADNVVIFAKARISGNQILAMANGNGVYTTDGTTLTDQSASPQLASHVAFLDRYLIVNKGDGSGEFKFSDLNDPATWPALNFAEAERMPDELIAVHTQGRELVLFGYDSIEFYYNDSTSPFRRFEGGEIDTGVSVAYSIQYVPEIASWLYLDENRQLIQLQNRTPQKVSGPYDDEIQSLVTADDGVSSIVRSGGRGFYVISFEDENVTFVYDYQIGTWYKWGNWNPATSSYDRFRGRVSTYNYRDNKYLVGDIDNGIIYALSNSTYQDNGQDIRTAIRTGFINHGTQNRKRSRKVQFRLKRGVAKDVSDTAGEINVRYRDDYTGSFGNEKSISTGIGGDSRFNTELYVGGIYRARQWEITSSDNTPFIIGGFEEDVKVLRN